MARNYRGGGQRDRNDPPGWGSSGQPARTFAFGSGGANTPGPVQQQPQMQNRFQALQPSRGRGGPACYICGQVGHLQRDCPQSSARRGGGSGAVRPGGSARVTDADAKRVVAEDMRESPPWPFSCYAPDFHSGSPGHNLLVGDVSFEEARAAAYSALVTGGPSAAQACSQRLGEAAQWRLNDRSRLAGMPQGELAQQLQAAAAGQPAQAAMPQLDWSFPAGAPAAGTHSLSPPPPLPPPPPLSASQAPAGQFANFAAQQQAQPQRTQPQQPTLSLLQQYVQSAPPAADPASGPPPAASDAECWLAPAFRLGAIPETAPPAQFA